MLINTAIQIVLICSFGFRVFHVQTAKLASLLSVHASVQVFLKNKITAMSVWEHV